MTVRKTRLKYFWLERDGRSFKLYGTTEKGADHIIQFYLDHIGTAMCGINTLSGLVKELVDEQRGTHRWAKEQVAARWRELDAAVGKDVQP